MCNLICVTAYHSIGLFLINKVYSIFRLNKNNVYESQLKLRALLNQNMKLQNYASFSLYLCALGEKVGYCRRQLIQRKEPPEVVFVGDVAVGIADFRRSDNSIATHYLAFA